MNLQSNSNNREQVNINTTAIQFKNSQGSSPSTMVIGYWNSLLSIKLHPPLDESKRSENEFFDYSKVISTAITLEKLLVIIKQIEEHILPAIENKKKIFKGVPVGGDTLVGVGVQIEDDTPVVYFAIFKGLDEKTMLPKEFIKYNFRTSYTVDNYDAEKGEFEITQNIQSEFITFYEVLKAAKIGLSNSTVHADRFVNKFFRDKLMGRIEDIATKVGVPSQQRYGYGRNSGGGGVFTSHVNQSPSRGESSYEAPTATLANLDDIDNYMS
jgi:hypothetical protein